ncbi:MAG: hypothetical protein BWX70_01794 [Verrucomicrobia bacterium ADurb.Bin070]|nr:MAG: hypothetical protein BWX70_01794 [Verrucomicrobia bacterium ADurb.Bin070]
MTGREAKDLIDAKIKEYVRTNHCKPKLIHLPVLIAHDLEKSGLSDLGSLLEAMSKNGIEALETYGYRGHPVKLELQEETEIVID